MPALVLRALCLLLGFARAAVAPAGLMRPERAPVVLARVLRAPRMLLLLGPRVLLLRLHGKACAWSLPKCM